MSWPSRASTRSPAKSTTPSSKHRTACALCVAGRRASVAISALTMITISTMTKTFYLIRLILLAAYAFAVLLATLVTGLYWGAMTLTP
jgi:hypothetical protein